MRRTLILLAAVFCLASAGLAAEFNLVPNRLARTKAGEWVILANLSNPDEKVKISVTGVECEGAEQVVVIVRQNLDADDNAVGEGVERRVKMSGYQDRLDKLDQRAHRISREKTSFNDRDITVYVVEWEDEEEDREIKIWLSYDIPVGGFVRIWSSDPDFHTYELVDYGN